MPEPRQRERGTDRERERALTCYVNARVWNLNSRLGSELSSIRVCVRACVFVVRALNANAKDCFKLSLYFYVFVLLLMTIHEDKS